MYLIRGINNINLFRAKHSEVSTVATIGNFDGLHLGHQQILKTMQKEADAGGLWERDRMKTTDKVTNGRRMYRNVHRARVRPNQTGETKITDYFSLGQYRQRH